MLGRSNPRDGLPNADLLKLKATLWRLVGFGLVPAVSILSLFVVVPIISRTAGEAGVIATTVGPSVGAVAAIVVSLGWPLLGPPLIARSSAVERAEAYGSSVRSRLLVLAVAAPVSAVIAVALVTERRTECALLAVAFAGTGMTCHWYYVGSGNALGLILRDAAPRMVALGVSAAAMVWGFGMVSYPLTLIFAAVTTYLLVLHDATGRLTVRFRRADILTVREHLHATLSRLMNGLYLSGAAPLVAAVAPASVVLFGTYDRVQKSALNAAATLPGAFDSTVASSYPPVLRRQSLVLACDAGLALMITLLLYVAYPALMAFLYSDVAVQDAFARVTAAVGCGLLFMNKTVLAHGLLPWKDERVVAHGLTSLAVVGVTAILVGALVAGAHGVFAVVVAVESVTLLLGLWRLKVLRPSPIAVSTSKEAS